MRMTRKSNLPDPSIDMTPMIDIVFQLISFFMLVTNFDQMEADERVKLPADQLARPPIVARQKEIVLNIGYKRDTSGARLDPDPFIFISGQEYRVLDSGKLLETERRIMTAKHGEEEVKAQTIVIRADTETPSGLVQELMRIAQQSGFEKFALKAMQDEVP